MTNRAELFRKRLKFVDSNLNSDRASTSDVWTFRSALFGLEPICCGILQVI